MKKGILHFDISEGCTAEALITAVSQLSASNDAHGSGVIAQALIRKIANNLRAIGLNEGSIADSMGIAEKFANHVARLDPLAIGASRVPISWPPQTNKAKILASLEGVPTYEREWPAPSTDLVSIVMLKSCVSRFGPRGDSVLLQTATSNNVHALWCEPRPIGTRAIETTQQELATPLMEVSAFIKQLSQIEEIKKRAMHLHIRSLTVSIATHQNQSGFLLMAQVTHGDAERFIEACLVIGEAAEVFSHPIECHALKKRIVSVPLGRSQSMQHCQVIEWLHGDQILRAEPEPSDLFALTGQGVVGQEIVRSDVMSAWRKWRGRN